jgi:hypothetical protein
MTFHGFQMVDGDPAQGMGMFFTWYPSENRRTSFEARVAGSIEVVEDRSRLLTPAANRRCAH